MQTKKSFLFGILALAILSIFGCDNSSAPPAEITNVEAMATPSPGKGEVSFKVNLGILPEKNIPTENELGKKSKATPAELDAMEYAWRQNQIKYIKLSFEPLDSSTWLYFQFEFKKNEQGEWEATGNVTLPAGEYNLYADLMNGVFISMYYAEPTRLSVVEGQNQTVNLVFYMQDYVYVRTIVENPIGYYTAGEYYDISFVGSYIGNGFSNSSAAYLDAQGRLNFDFYAYRPWNNGKMVVNINNTIHTFDFQIENFFNSLDGIIYLQYMPSGSLDFTVAFDDPPITCDLLFNESGLPYFQCYQTTQSRRFDLVTAEEASRYKFSFIEAQGTLYGQGIILFYRKDLTTNETTLVAIRIEYDQATFYDIQTMVLDQEADKFYMVPLLIKILSSQKVVVVCATQAPNECLPGDVCTTNYYLDEVYFNDGFLRGETWNLSRDQFDQLFLSEIIVQTTPDLAISVADLGITWFPEMYP